MWEDEVGEFGQRPEAYWTVLLAHGTGLRPRDLGELTYFQLYAAVAGTNDAFGG